MKRADETSLMTCDRVERDVKALRGVTRLKQTTHFSSRDVGSRHCHVLTVKVTWPRQKLVKRDVLAFRYANRQQQLECYPDWKFATRIKFRLRSSRPLWPSPRAISPE